MQLSIVEISKPADANVIVGQAHFIKTVEDLAGCATDDLIGWTERKDGEAVRQAGILDGFELTRDDAETIIVQARLKAGWITEADLAPPASAEAAPAEAQA